MISSFAFDPLLGLPLTLILSGLAFLAAILSGLGGTKSFLPRILAASFLAAALLNPQTVEEERDPLPDHLLILKDTSESVTLGGRDAVIDKTYKDLFASLETVENLDVTTVDIATSSDGTQMTSSLVEALGQLPRDRLAGIITLTDGRVHDVVDGVEKLIPEGVPFHSLILEDNQNRDRRIRAITAPRYGLVGEQADYVVRVDDPGHEGEEAWIQMKLNGEVKARFPAIIGDRVSLPLEIERRGNNIVELIVQSVEGELTLNNNIFVSEISGIRDRMRVLLVIGQPHQGGRAWRNLLKSDPSVDLVQFTILTNPGTKTVNARPNELSLIAFPTRELFLEKLDEFDLVIFDQFTRRRAPGRSGRAAPLLSPYYIQNIAQYVENGGALLVATGPGFATEDSLYRSPLAAVLPARPTGETADYSFKPKINDKGARHPVTEPFVGKEDQDWGEWYRIIESDIASGNILMEGPAGEPLLIIEKVSDGRVAMLMSDQAWLWSRGHNGGGPYSELFRRLAHWLLGEPDLDAETLSARPDGNSLLIERKTLEDNTGTVSVGHPDGRAQSVTLTKVEDGLYQARLPLAEDGKGQGAYRLTSGDLTALTAIGALNPKEYDNLMPTVETLKPVSEATGGKVARFGEDNPLPAPRSIDAGKTATGDDWYGLVANKAYVTRLSRRTPLAPGWLFFLLSALMLAWAWRREGI